MWPPTDGFSPGWSNQVVLKVVFGFTENCSISGVSDCSISGVSAGVGDNALQAISRKCVRLTLLRMTSKMPTPIQLVPNWGFGWFGVCEW
jgi:hypothetical protein